MNVSLRISNTQYSAKGMTAMSIYRITQSQEDIAPRLQVAGFRGDWDELLSEGSDEPIELKASPRRVRTDFYDLAGTLGVASQPLADLICQWSDGGICERKLRVNGEEYGVLIPRTFSDVLDLAQSECKFFASDPTIVMDIKSYRFLAERIQNEPWAFVIPESPGELLLNASAVSVLLKTEMSGWHLAAL